MDESTTALDTANEEALQLQPTENANPNVITVGCTGYYSRNPGSC
jgi:hypothetical protein